MNIVLLAPTQDYPNGDLHDAIGRIRSALLEKLGVTCLVATWKDFKFSTNDVWLTSGIVREGDGYASARFDPPLHPDYVYFYCTSSNRRLDPNPEDRPCFESLHGLGILKGITSYNGACYRILSAMAERGVLVNYDRDAARWGVKNVLEARCRRSEASSGRWVPRPRTELVRLPGDERELLEFVESNGPCIVKPENSSRARGLFIIDSRSQLAALNLPGGGYVVQELVVNPATLYGRKFDLRAYVLLSNLEKTSYSIPKMILIRSAVEQYARGSLSSEVCSTSFAKRMGVRPALYLLEEMRRSQEETSVDWGAIRASTEEALDSLMAAVARRAETQPKLPSLTLWGIDLAVQNAAEGPRVLVLEVNPFPMLYRGDETSDRAMDEVIAELFEGAANIVSAGHEPNASTIASDSIRVANR